MTLGDLDLTPAAHVAIHDEAISPALMISHSRRPGGATLLSLAETLMSGRGSAGAHSNEDEVDSLPHTPFLVHFVLGNFFLAMFLVSLTIFTLLLNMTWFTVLRDARLMRDQAFSNTARVSYHLYHTK